MDFPEKDKMRTFDNLFPGCKTKYSPTRFYLFSLMASFLAHNYLSARLYG
jgi:hypothetical protein